MNWLDEIGNDLPHEEHIEVLDTDNLEMDWRIKRLGNLTGSNFGKLVKGKGDKFFLSTGKVASDLIYKIAWERMLKQGNISNGLGRLSVSSQSMNHGNDYEGEAILKYQEKTGNKVIYSQEYISLNDWVGGTPDGLIDKDGIIEVKCPWNGGNHLQTLITGRLYNPEHYFQIQGYLWITGRKYCEFVTYDPDLIEGLQLSITKIERCEDTIKGIELVMNEVIEKVKLIIKQIEK
jgi:hypothetical protein